MTTDYANSRIINTSVVVIITILEVIFFGIETMVQAKVESGTD